MIRLTVLTAFAAISIVLCSSALAFDGPGFGDGPGPDGMMGLHGDIDAMTSPGMNKACRTPEFYLKKAVKLELSPEQIDRMEANYFELKRTMIEKGAAVKVLELELTEIVGKPDFDLVGAKSVMEKVEKARTELRGAVLESAAAARDILTPEQLEMVGSMRRSPVDDRPYRRQVRKDKTDRDGYMPDEDRIRRKMERNMKERMGAPENMPEGMPDGMTDDY
jgi:Spy/CpxP family protein refolding chaperone